MDCPMEARFLEVQPEDDGACQVVVDDAHNQFQNAVLDIFQSEMIAVQNPPG